MHLPHATFSHVPLLLYKEQIIEKIDENPEIQTTLETHENMTTSKQNLDIPVSELMETVD